MERKDTHKDRKQVPNLINIGSPGAKKPLPREAAVGLREKAQEGGRMRAGEEEEKSQAWPVPTKCWAPGFALRWLVAEETWGEESGQLWGQQKPGELLQPQTSLPWLCLELGG